MYSLSFKNCKTIYPFKLIRPLNKHEIDHKGHFRDVINDIIENNLKLDQVIADKLKRSFLKDIKGHSSWFPCEYCYAKGVKIDINENSKARKKLNDQITFLQEKISQLESLSLTNERKSQIENLKTLKEELGKSMKSLKKKSNILWPSSTMDSTHRSRRSILEIVEKLENGQDLTVDEAKGIKGRSILLDVPQFNFVYDCPAEYMHCVCLGNIKKLVELTFNVGVKRDRVTKRKLSSCAEFNKLMSKIKVVHEFSRRARNLDFSVFKAEEFRNLGLIFFPLVLECIEDGAEERKLWLYIAYMLRSAVIPSTEFEQINIDNVNASCAAFYELFEKLFGKLNCPYNLHVLCSHLFEMRTHGPLTETSAFKFESFYGEMRRSFVTSTISPLKQILKNILLKRTILRHQCKKNVFISNYETSLECNNLVYTYRRKEYTIYKVNEINDNIVSCNKIGLYPAVFTDTPNINFSSVGVFRKGGICSDNINILLTDIGGKVVKVDEYLLTCPNNVLNER